MTYRSSSLPSGPSMPALKVGIAYAISDECVGVRTQTLNETRRAAVEEGAICRGWHVTDMYVSLKIRIRAVKKERAVKRDANNVRRAAHKGRALCGYVIIHLASSRSQALFNDIRTLDG